MPSSTRCGVTGLVVAIRRGGRRCACERPGRRKLARVTWRRPPWPTLIIADAANDRQRRNKFVRSLIMTVISVVPGSVKRVSVSAWQRGQ
jgi:hypothetical protein